MKKNLSDYLVALAVIACSLVLLIALTVALSGYRLKKPARTVQIDYPDVTGIHLASELRYAGAGAGHVTSVRLLTADERRADSQVALGAANAVRITVEVNNDVPPIPDDTHASIEADTLLSEKFISLSAGSVISSGSDGSNVHELANNAVIQGYPGGLDTLLRGGGGLVTQIQGALATVVPKLNKALDDGDNLLSNAGGLVSQNGSLRLTIDQAHDAAVKLQGVEDNLNDVLQKAGGFVTSTGQNVDGRMKELAVVLQNLKVATTYLKAFTKQLGEKPNRVIFSGKSEKLAPEEEIIKSPKPVPATPDQPQSQQQQ